MESSNLAANLISALEQGGYRGKIVSVEHLSDLQNDIGDLHRQGLFDEEFYAEELRGFDFTIPDSLPGAKSLIIAAAPQPQVRATFTLEDKELPCTIPPTYSHATDRKIEKLLQTQLGPAGFHIQMANIPRKLLAVRSGLARYGKNNITYIEGLGSFYRLVALLSDFPCIEDRWQDLGFLKECTNCDVCTRACPGGAIGAGRFLLHAERCLTFQNERPPEFPAWLNPSWHHCLVGCMICQKVCPVNKDFRKWVVEGPSFSAQETDLMIQRVSRDKFPLETIQKLETIDMIEYLGVLGRNLQALAGRQHQD
jgi:epoxyqueuosine reductase